MLRNGEARREGKEVIATADQWRAIIPYTPYTVSEKIREACTGRDDESIVWLSVPDVEYTSIMTAANGG